MKKLLAVIVLLVAIALHTSAMADASKSYAIATRVICLDYVTNTVYAEDETGNIWSWFEIEDWCLGDTATLVMDTNGTPEIYDDIVVSAKYSTWTLSNPVR